MHPDSKRVSEMVGTDSKRGFYDGSVRHQTAFSCMDTDTKRVSEMVGADSKRGSRWTFAESKRTYRLAIAPSEPCSDSPSAVRTSLAR